MTALTRLSDPECDRTAVRPSTPTRFVQFFSLLITEIQGVQPKIFWLGKGWATANRRGRRLGDPPPSVCHSERRAKPEVELLRVERRMSERAKARGTSGISYRLLIALATGNEYFILFRRSLQIGTRSLRRALPSLVLLARFARPAKLRLRSG